MTTAPYTFQVILSQRGHHQWKVPDNVTRVSVQLTGGGAFHHTTVPPIPVPTYPNGVPESGSSISAEGVPVKPKSTIDFFVGGCPRIPPPLPFVHDPYGGGDYIIVWLPFGLGTFYCDAIGDSAQPVTGGYNGGGDGYAIGISRVPDGVDMQMCTASGGATDMRTNGSGLANRVLAIPGLTGDFVGGYFQGFGGGPHGGDPVPAYGDSPPYPGFYSAEVESIYSIGVQSSIGPEVPWYREDHGFGYVSGLPVVAPSYDWPNVTTIVAPVPGSPDGQGGSSGYVSPVPLVPGTFGAPFGPGASYNSHARPLGITPAGAGGYRGGSSQGILLFADDDHSASSVAPYAQPDPTGTADTPFMIGFEAGMDWYTGLRFVGPRGQDDDDDGGAGGFADSSYPISSGGLSVEILWYLSVTGTAHFSNPVNGHVSPDFNASVDPAVLQLYLEADPLIGVGGVVVTGAAGSYRILWKNGVFTDLGLNGAMTRGAGFGVQGDLAVLDPSRVGDAFADGAVIIQWDGERDISDELDGWYVGVIGPPNGGKHAF